MREKASKSMESSRNKKSIFTLILEEEEEDKKNTIYWNKGISQNQTLER